MGRKPRQVVKGKHSTAHYFQLSKPDGLKQVKLRVKIQDYTSPIDLPLIYEGKKIKLLESQFDGGRITGGFENGHLVDVNYYMQGQQVRAVNIADDHYIRNVQLTGSQLSALLSRPSKEHAKTDAEIAVPVPTRPRYKPSPKDEQELKQVLTGKLDMLEYARRGEARKEMFYKKIEADNSDDFAKIYKHKESWDDTNIFQLLGYVRYGTKLDALDHEVPFISKPYKRLYKKLIFYRVNVKPSEHKSQFNAQWVHGFYKFLYQHGFERRLQKVTANPFKIDPTFTLSNTKDKEEYNVNTFGQGIHKHMRGYITVLKKHKLIDVDFGKDIEVSTFTKKYDGNLSSYGETIYYVTPKEFLACLKHDVPDKKLNTIRHLFICQVMMGAMRIKNLNGKKIVEQLDHFSMINFKQAKVNTLMSNVMLKPVRNILALYNNELPQLKEADYNEGLKSLFKYFVDKKHISDRTITKAIKKLTGESEEHYKLHELVSSKFARSTYYVINGMLGVPIEEIAKRAGHSTTDLAMKHYYNKAKENYTEEDRIELFEHFKK